MLVLKQTRTGRSESNHISGGEIKKEWVNRKGIKKT
jgi:hypothetical protein